MALFILQAMKQAVHGLGEKFIYTHFKQSAFLDSIWSQHIKTKYWSLK
jgi:hypothetical protein